MKKVNIFLASSSSLAYERNLFSVMANKINYEIKDTNYRVNIIRWEHLDSSMQIKRKQDEYNRAIKECDLVVLLASKFIGNYTLEEYNKAKIAITNDGVDTNKLLVYLLEETYDIADLTKQTNRISAPEFKKIVESDSKSEENIQFKEFMSIDECISDFKDNVLSPFLSDVHKVSNATSPRNELNYTFENLYLYVSNQNAKQEFAAVNDFIHQYNKINVLNKPEIYIVDRLELLEKSHIIIALYFDNLGYLNENALLRLYNNLRNSSIPNYIYVFFNENNENEEITVFKEKFDKPPYEHFYSTFKNVEKIKFELFAQMIIKLGKDVYKVYNSKVLNSCGEVLFDIDKADVYSDNEMLNTLFTKRKRLHENLEKMIDEECLNEDYYNVMNEISVVNEQIERHTNSICELAHICYSEDVDILNGIILDIQKLFRQGKFSEVEILINSLDKDKSEIVNHVIMEGIILRQKRYFEILDWRITNIYANNAISNPDKEQIIANYIHSNIEWINKLPNKPIEQLKRYLYRYIDILSEYFYGAEDDVQWLHKALLVTDYASVASRLCGNYYWRKNNIERTMVYYDFASIHLDCNFSNYAIDKMELLTDKGLLFTENFEFDKALRCHMDSLAMCDSINFDDSNIDKLAATYNNIGRFYRLEYNNLYNSDKAKDYLIKSIDIRRRLSRDSNPRTLGQLSFPLNNIALLLLNEAKRDVSNKNIYLSEALGYIDEGLICIGKYNNTLRLIGLMDTKAQILYMQNEISKAKNLYEDALNIVEHIEVNVKRKADFYLNFAKFCNNTTQVAEAKKYLGYIFRSISVHPFR